MKHFKPEASAATQITDTSTSASAAAHAALASHEPPEAVQILSGNCMMCHAHESAKYYIPFGNERTLRTHLEANPRLIREIRYRTNPQTSASARMPYLGSPLSASQYAVIEKYLNSLSNWDSRPLSEPPASHDNQ